MSTDGEPCAVGPATSISEESWESLRLRVHDTLESIQHGGSPPRYHVEELVRDLWNEVAMLTSSIGEQSDVRFCPQCGNGVNVDEDGCCTICGADTCAGPMYLFREIEHLRNQVTSLQEESTREVERRREAVRDAFRRGWIAAEDNLHDRGALS